VEDRSPLPFFTLLVQEEASELTSYCLQEYPFDIPTEAFTFQIFKQAFAAVQASVVHLQVCNSPVDTRTPLYVSLLLLPKQDMDGASN
jgi:hypothetical protein